MNASRGTTKPITPYWGEERLRDCCNAAKFEAWPVRAGHPRSIHFIGKSTMKVFTNPEQFAANNKASMEALLTVTDRFFTMVGRLMDVNSSFVSGLMQEGIARTTVLVSSREPQALLFFPAEWVEPLMQKSANYAHDVSSILADQQQGLAALVDARIGALRLTLAQELDHATRTAPGGSEALLEGMKSALAAGYAAYDQMRTASSELAGIGRTHLIGLSEEVVHPVSQEGEQSALKGSDTAPR